MVRDQRDRLAPTGSGDKTTWTKSFHCSRKVYPTDYPRPQLESKLDGCIVWNAHNTVLGEEALLIYIVPVCYVKTGRYGKT